MVVRKVAKMNEKINELYKQAHITETKKVRKGGWDNDREPFEYETVSETKFSPEKFAELLIKECARVPINMWDKAELNADVAVKIEDRIRSHFGIELVKINTNE